MLNILLPKYVEINFEPLSLRDIETSCYLFFIKYDTPIVNSNEICIDTLLESNFPINIQLTGTISII